MRISDWSSDVCSSDLRATALQGFYDRWKDDPLVVDKWFAIQATSQLPGTVEAVKDLTLHPAYDPRNPNRVRSVVAAFSAANPLHFHAAAGAGYAFLADQVHAIDPRNPRLAAPLVPPPRRWPRQAQGRRRADEAP